ncbi:MAG: rhodanese-like domain-containing protein [Sandaracinaceae bacterium]
MPLSDLSIPDVLLRENWETHVRYTTDGTPVLPPSFVAEAGPRVWIVDVRDDDELTDAAGHIPGTWRMPIDRVGEIKKLLPGYTPVVLVCSDGARSTTAARYLAALGMTTVAAMNGGMHGWRQEGFASSRDPAIRHNILVAPAPGNGSDGRPLAAPKGERRLSVARILEHVGDVSKVRRVKLAAFLLASQTSCVDGREDRAIIGTPGGDAGELVLGLAAAEQVGGSRVDLAHVPDLTRAFADTFGGIYLHTDNHALNHLARVLHGDSRLEGAVASLSTIDHWEAFLRRPPEGVREALLEHLMQPANVGCGHLKLALLNADTYGVRPGLIEEVFRSFYRGLWSGAADLEWVVLGGDHAEGAVVNVTMEGELWPFSEVPMLAPSIGGVQMFVNHPQVVTYLREQTARFLSSRVDHLLPIGKSHGDSLAQAIPELGGAQAMATLKALAGGLPTFSVHFGSDGIDVQQGDDIPRA